MGKGFQGVMRRWNFSGGTASHGNSLAHRTPGTTGQHQVGDTIITRYMGEKLIRRPFMLNLLGSWASVAWKEDARTDGRQS
jgi:hypothetical protein